MLADPNPDSSPRTGIRIYVAGSVAVFALVLSYLGWVFWSRAHETRLIEERAAAQRRAQDEQTVEGMGGNRFDILSFYATEGAIERGDSTDLCYSTSNTRAVTIDPPVGLVWPAFERCISISPRKTTTYTLVAADGAGHRKSAAVTVEVR